MSDNPTPPTLPEDHELAELRGRLRGQWKVERRAEEREALREHWLQRDLIGAVTEAMHRGDHVAFTLPGNRTFAGRVIAVERDYAILHIDQPTSREVAIRLPATDPAGSADPYRGPPVLVEITNSGETGVDSPLPPRDAPSTFQAVLHQYDFEQQQHPTRQIELGTTFHPDGLLCHLQAHAGDHLFAHNPSDSHHLLVAAAAITYVSWIPDQRWRT